jgi:hypothetical protein
MIFGLSNVVASIASSERQDMFMLIGGILVGSSWFAFGWYGGLPLVETVVGWRPSANSTAIEEMHRQGLIVMRRRRWMGWLAIPGGLAAAALLIPLLMQTSHPEFVVLLIGPPIAFIQFRYYLSRCPRCGFGFFTKSISRAALIRRGNTCGHCGLSLNADRKQ